MKKNNTIPAFLLTTSLAILATSCGENEMEEMMPDITPQTYSLIFDAVKPSFELEEEGGSTRASGNSWTNNDEIFLFVNANAAGHAKYSNGSWTFTAYPNKSFANTTDSDCKVYYFENSTKGMYGSDISIDENTPLYHANAKYSVKNGTITVKAKLTPKAFRFRFKNETGSDVSFSLDSDSKINYYKSWSYASGKFDYAPKTISGTAVSNKYSDYYYGTYKDSPSSISLTLTIGNTQYTRKFSTSQLVADTGSKNSGCFKLPASDSNLNGWTKKGPNFNGHEYVDLGLKDEQGNTIYWATCNLGADRPEDYGLYFAWGEIEGYNRDASDGHVFDWEHYKWMKKGYSSEEHITKYTFADDLIEADWYSNGYFMGDNLTNLLPEDDAAHVKWGGDWRMPTRSEGIDLETKCDWNWNESKNGYDITGPNGRSIFLPAASMRRGIELTHWGWSPSCNYWTSTLGYRSSEVFCIYQKDGVIPYYDPSRYYGRSIRAVCVSPN